MRTYAYTKQKWAICLLIWGLCWKANDTHILYSQEIYQLISSLVPRIQYMVMFSQRIFHWRQRPMYIRVLLIWLIMLVCLEWLKQTVPMNRPGKECQKICWRHSAKKAEPCNPWQDMARGDKMITKVMRISSVHALNSPRRHCCYIGVLLPFVSGQGTMLHIHVSKNIGTELGYVVEGTTAI